MPVNDQVNAACTEFLKASIEAGSMLPLDHASLRGFMSDMEPAVSLYEKAEAVNGKEVELMASILVGLKREGHKATVVVPIVNEDSNGEWKVQPRKRKGKSDAVQEAVTVATEEKKSEPEEQPFVEKLQRPSHTTRFSTAMNSKDVIAAIFKSDNVSMNRRHISGTKIDVMYLSTTITGTSSAIVFFCPQLADYNPLELGIQLNQQRGMLYDLADQVKEQVKTYLIQNQFIESQFIFTGYASAAIVAQLVALKLNFDDELRVYRDKHRILSIGFGDVSFFSEHFVRELDRHGFDHQDHLSFRSTEAFFPMNVAMNGRLNFVGRRIEFDLKQVKASYKQEAQSVEKPMIETPLLLKYIDLDIYEALTIAALESADSLATMDRTPLLQAAVADLEERFRELRLKNYEDLTIQCSHQPNGSERDTLPNDRVACQISDGKTLATIELYFQIYWTNDVHDINVRFYDKLVTERKEAFKHTGSKMLSTSELSKSTTASSSSTTTSSFTSSINKGGKKSRKNFANWVELFQQQLQGNLSSLEKTSKTINPFFEESCLFTIGQGNCYYSLKLRSEVLSRSLLSRKASDQLLVRQLFGPVNPNIRYINEDLASELFRAPVAVKKSTDYLNGNLIQYLEKLIEGGVKGVKGMAFMASGQIETFQVERIESFNMDGVFNTGVQLAKIIETVKLEATEPICHSCDHYLPARECPRAALLRIFSPFWLRVFKIDDIFFSFRGEDGSGQVEADIMNFCKEFRSCSYGDSGAMVIYKITGEYNFGRLFAPRRAMYLMIAQDPSKKA